MPSPFKILEYKSLDSTAQIIKSIRLTTHILNHNLDLPISFDGKCIQSHMYLVSICDEIQYLVKRFNWL